MQYLTIKDYTSELEAYGDCLGEMQKCSGAPIAGRLVLRSVGARPLTPVVSVTEMSCQRL